MAETAPTTNTIEPDGPEGLTGKYYCALRLFDYKRPTPFGNSFEPTSDIINLPLPIQLYDMSASSFAGQDLGLIGEVFNESLASGLASAGLRTVLNAPQLATAGLSAVSKSGIPILKDFANALLGISNAASKGLGIRADAITTGIEQTIGAIPNPNPTVRFTGPVLRDFSFTWYLNAKNETESMKFKEIISKLKSASLPKNEYSGVSGILSYPKLAQINFYPWDNDANPSTPAEGQKAGLNKWGWTEKSIIRIKRCFISQVSVNYNPANVPSFFYDNSPVVIELTITLKEIEYLTGNEWDYGKLKFESETTANEVFQPLINQGAQALDSINKTNKALIEATLGRED